MQILYDSCCGLDVHAKTVVACLIKQGKKEIRTFSTMTSDLLKLLDWLIEQGCTHAAIESTGVYWKPVFNVLEGTLEVILVNAYHVKAVPGRKTDVRDCEWLADLLRHGLLKASFIPPIEIRVLRELTRYRQSVVKEQAIVANQIQKIAESGNIKLGQVASDPLGVSGRAMLRALAQGETDAAKLATLARRRLKQKQAELQLSLEGRLNEAQRWILNEMLDRYEQLEAAIERVNRQIARKLETAAHPFLKQAVELIQEIPGIGERVAQTIISEIGIEMDRFPSPAHLASWAGMCPGNHESAGRRQRGQTTKGSIYLRVALVQAAWAATHTKETYLAAQYQKLIKRLGRKKALVAVGHSILLIVYQMLKNRVNYCDLGADYFDRLSVERQRRNLIRRLEALGCRVSIELKDAPV